MKKYIRLALVMLLMLFVLTGCTNTEYDVKVKKDGKGTVECKVEYDEKILQNEYESDIASIEDYGLLDTLKTNAKENGYNFEWIKKNNYTSGCKISKEFDDIAKEFKAQDSIDEEHVTIKDDSGIQVKKGFFITTYSQSFTVDTKNGGDVINTIKLTYHFPVGISKSNADKGIFNLTWNIGSYQEKKIEYTVYSFNLPLIVLMVAVIIAVIIVIKKIVCKNKSEKSVKTNKASKRMK